MCLLYVIAPLIDHEMHLNKFYIALEYYESDNSMVERWTCCHENVSLNPGRGGLPMWPGAPHIDSSSKDKYYHLNTN